MKITVNSTKTENTEIKVKRKFVKVQNEQWRGQVPIWYQFRCDINKWTWKKIGTLILLKTENIAHAITGNKPKFVSERYTKVTFMGKTFKLWRFATNWSQKLFVVEWIETFDLLNQPMISFCYSVNVNFNRAKKKKLKKN